MIGLLLLFTAVEPVHALCAALAPAWTGSADAVDTSGEPATVTIVIRDVGGRRVAALTTSTGTQLSWDE